MVIPFDAPVNIAAVATYHNAGQCILTTVEDEMLWMDGYLPENISVTSLSFFQTPIQHWELELVLPEDYPALVYLLKPSLTGFPVDSFNLSDFTDMMGIDAESSTLRSGKILCMKISGPLTGIADYIRKIKFSDVAAAAYILQGIWTLKDAAQIEDALRAATFSQIQIIRALSFEEKMENPVVTLIIKTK